MADTGSCGICVACFVILSLTLVGVVVAIVAVVIFIVRRNKNTDNAFMPSNGIYIATHLFVVYHEYFIA